jgi:hypothetical protein
MKRREPSGQPEYDTKDLLRYLKGNMSQKEMFLLEKAALDDPFLQDALEGMQQMEEKEDGRWSASVERLQKEWTADQHKSRTIPLLRWMVAATLLLAVLAAGIKFAVNKQDQQPLAVADNRNQPLPDEKSDSPLATPAAPNDQLKNEKLDNNAAGSALTQKKNSVNTTAKSPPNTAYNKAQQPGIKLPAPSEIHEQAGIAPVVRSQSHDLETKSNINDTALTEIVVSSAYSKAPDTIKARASANSFGTLKAEKKTGAYGETLPESPANNLQELSVAKAGIMKKESPLRPSESKQKEATKAADSQPSPKGKLALADAVRTQSGYLSPKDSPIKKGFLKDSPDADVNPVENSALLNPGAMPVNGWKAYEAYIKNNRKSVPGEKPGSVILRFFLDRQNQVSDIRVERSLTEGQDEEAIRLLTEGPAWKLTQNSAVYVRLIIRF